MLICSNKFTIFQGGLTIAVSHLVFLQTTEQLELRKTKITGGHKNGSYENKLISWMNSPEANEPRGIMAVLEYL